MADIFQEVDEEIRRERLKELWDRYGNLIVVGALVIVLGVAGWRGYQWWDHKKSAEAGAAFEAAIGLSEAGKHAEAEASFAKIAADGTSGYRTLARFHEAGELGQTDPQAAVKAYEALAADSSIGRVMQDLAAVRAGLILVDTAPYAELSGRLEPMTASDRVFHNTAREILAFSAWRASDRAAARHWADMIMTDPETPSGTRSRVEVLMALTAPDGKS
ncbi:MAG TPA: tetratricopeptide repeat protein [Xanthobacteraceae bacterium]|nr:tetratricopeptide repeat protein [Xanthobacteraceae bacterium]